jgi:YHS domain-containing protein
MALPTILDPICDMIVDVAEARDQGLTMEMEREYAFCSHGCLVKFSKSPQTYIPKVNAWLAQQERGEAHAAPTAQLTAMAAATADQEDRPIDFQVRLLKDNATYSVRYTCACGCNPQVKLQADGPAAHEHCCCGIAHAAGPGAREHLETYLAERKAGGEDVGRGYTVTEVALTDPWGRPLPAAYAIPSPTALH